MRSRLHVYLLLPHIALQIDADYWQRGWQSILSPVENPEVFGVLGEAGVALEGGGSTRPLPGAWPPLAQQFLRDRRRRWRERLHEPGLAGEEGAGFLRLFWKALQLELIHRSAGTGTVLYPMTLPTVERALGQEGWTVPPWLDALRDAYQTALEGRRQNVAPLIPAALAYWKDVERACKEF